MPLRNIGPNTCSLTGRLWRVDGELDYFESNLECFRYLFLRYEPGVAFWKGQSVQIPWTSAKGIETVYTPDITIGRSQDSLGDRPEITLEEVKPQEELDANAEQWEPKWAAARAYCAEHRFNFRFWTNLDVNLERLLNIRLIRFMIPWSDHETIVREIHEFLFNNGPSSLKECIEHVGVVRSEATVCAVALGLLGIRTLVAQLDLELNCDSFICLPRDQDALHSAPGLGATAIADPQNERHARGLRLPADQREAGFVVASNMVADHFRVALKVTPKIVLSGPPAGLPDVASPSAQSISIHREPTRSEALREEALRQAVRYLTNSLRPEQMKGMRFPKRHWADCQAKTGIPWETIRKYFNVVRRFGTYEAIKVRRSRGGVGKSRLSECADAIIAEKLSAYLDNRLKSRRAVVEGIGGEVDRKKLDCSDRTAYRRVHDIPQQTVISKRRGSKEFEEQFALHVEGMPEYVHPLELVQIDEGHLDANVTELRTRRNAGRGRLLIGVSASTFVVWSIVLCIEVARACDVSTLIYRGVLPKEDLVQKCLPLYDIKNGIPWTDASLSNELPLYGHAHLHSDNGAIFRKKSLEAYNKSHKTDWTFRPLAKASSGGLVEAIMDVVNTVLHEIHGTTESNPERLGDYDSEGKATLTIDEVMQVILLGLRRWHNTEKALLGDMTPMQKLYTDMQGGVRGLPFPPPPRLDDPAQRYRLWVDVLPRARKVVGEQGIKIKHYKYWHPELRPYQKARSAKKAERVEYSSHPDRPELIHARLTGAAGTRIVDVRCSNLRQMERLERIKAAKLGVTQPFTPLNRSEKLAIREQIDHIVSQSEKDMKQVRRKLESDRTRQKNLPDFSSSAPNNGSQTAAHQFSTTPVKPLTSK